jgi:hypothetical protein
LLPLNIRISSLFTIDYIANDGVAVNNIQELALLLKGHVHRLRTLQLNASTPSSTETILAWIGRGVPAPVLEQLDITLSTTTSPFRYMTRSILHRG